MTRTRQGEPTEAPLPQMVGDPVRLHWHWQPDDGRQTRRGTLARHVYHIIGVAVFLLAVLPTEVVAEEFDIQRVCELTLRDGLYPIDAAALTVTGHFHERFNYDTAWRSITWMKDEDGRGFRMDCIKKDDSRYLEICLVDQSTGGVECGDKIEPANEAESEPVDEPEVVEVEPGPEADGEDKISFFWFLKYFGGEG